MHGLFFCLVVSCDSLRRHLDYLQLAATTATGPRAPPVANFLEGQDAENAYADGIYVGYRHHNTFKVEPAYKFGYGLSYTTFTYSPLKLSMPTCNGKLTTTLTVTKIGKVAGKEAVQLYMSAPAGKLAKPPSELKAFGKMVQWTAK